MGSQIWDGEEDANVDDARPIGAIPLWRPAHARRARRGADGEIVFGTEEPIAVSLAPRHVELQSSEARLWRLEVKDDASSREQGPKLGDHLIIAEYPYASGVVEHTPFKRGSHHGRDERRPLAASGLEQSAQEIDALRNDLWEKGKGLTAALSAGPAPVSLPGRPRAYRARGALLFGVCEDFPRLVTSLRASAGAERLLAFTRAGRLRILRPAPGERFGVPVVLHAECVDAAETLLLFAIRQALAGPREGLRRRTREAEAQGDAEEDVDQKEDVDQETPSAEAGQDPWVGAPVFELADRIYRSHLFNCTRAIWRREGREVPSGDLDE